MSDKNISVLMTVYNAEKYLHQAIQSVLNQTFKDFEFLIIDDASTDKSVEIIKSCQVKDPRIVLYQNKENLGQTRSLNLGLQLAKGDYIARIDADDIAFPHWLESQINFIKAHNDVDVLSAGIVTFNEGRIKKTHASLYAREDMLLRSIINSPINHGSSFIKRELVLKSGGYDNSYRIAADYGLWVRLLKQGAKINSNSDILMAVRRFEESISQANQHTQVVLEVAQIIKEHVSFITDINLIDEESLLLCKAHYCEGQVTFDDFVKAVEVHRKIYANFKKDLGFNKRKISFWFNQQRKTFLLRRIYFYLLKNDRGEIRRTAKYSFDIIGFHWLLMGLFFASFFHKRIWRAIIGSYHYFYFLNAKLTLKRELLIN